MAIISVIFGFPALVTIKQTIFEKRISTPKYGNCEIENRSHSNAQCACVVFFGPSLKFNLFKLLKIINLKKIDRQIRHYTFTIVMGRGFCGSWRAL